ncbi:MAG TPA: cellulose binding domain-containing protein [Pilimelia sp.]|nr:cellulose binding domain-containing protein [Pilimelia sp.]
MAIAATNPAAPAASGLTASFSKDSDWGSGYQGKFTISNKGAATKSWKLEFTLPASASLGTFWDASLTKTGGKIVATDRGYNAVIATNSSTSFGFIVAGSGAPTSCTINGAPCSGGGNPGPAPSATGTKPPAPQPTTPAPTTSAPKPPPPPPAPPAPGPGNVLVAPYVDMGLLSNPGSPTLAQLAQSSGVKAFTMAFVTSAGCKASWFNAFDPRAATFKDQIDALRRQGGDVKISFGGATGIELAQACTDVNALQAEYQAVVSAYNLKFIDLDVEGAAAAEPASISRRSQALAALQKRNPGLKISLTLPVLPEGLTQDGLNVVRSARDAGVNLDLVNIMAMDYGRAGQDYGNLAIQAVQSTQKQMKSLFPNLSDAQAFRMVGVTPMLGVNDDRGVFSQSDARDLVNFGNTNHIGYMSFWETNRDKNACNGALFQCTNVPQSPFEFSKIFAGFRG